MGYSNKHAMRILSYQILLSALDKLYDKNHNSLLPLLTEAINLHPFYPEEWEAPTSSFCKFINNIIFLFYFFFFFFTKIIN